MSFLYLKFKTPAHVTTHYLQISWHDINLKLHWGYRLTNEVGEWLDQLDHMTFFKNCILVYKLHAALLLNLLCPNLNFLAGTKVDISSMIPRSCTLEIISRKSDHIYDVIYRPHLSRGILDVSFQLTPRRETCI